MSDQGAFSRQGLLQRLLDMRQQLGIVMIVIGLAIGGLGVYLIVKAGRAEFSSRFPGGWEGIACCLIGLVLIGGGLWTQLTLERSASVDFLRTLLLFVGSGTGLIIAVFTMLRFALWWNEHLSRGVASWQGEEGWRFWLCAYVELIGLALLFGSLLLARVDIRSNVGMRRLLYGYNAFLTGFLLFVTLVVLNIIVFVKLPSNVEWNIKGLYSLSEVSKGGAGESE